MVARAYGFESWPKLKAFVDGATVRRLVDAVRGGDTERVRAMLNLRPELARMSIDNLQVVHHAVLVHAPQMVRFLMTHGANAREGVYPHRDATTAHALALQREDEAISSKKRNRNVAMPRVDGPTRRRPTTSFARSSAPTAIARSR